MTTVPKTISIDNSIVFDEASEFDDIYDFMRDTHGDDVTVRLMKRRRGDKKWSYGYLGQEFSTDREEMLATIEKFEGAYFVSEFCLVIT